MLGASAVRGRSPALASDSSPPRPWRPLDQVRPPLPFCGSEQRILLLLPTPPASLRTSPPPTLKPGPVEARRHPWRRTWRPAALAASTGTVADGRPNGGMDLKQLVGARHRLSSWCAAGPGARQCGTPVRGLTLARRASAHQASAGRWTAAGDHAPIVERSIANQQQPHHHHQADPSILLGQPAPSDPGGARTRPIGPWRLLDGRPPASQQHQTTRPGQRRGQLGVRRSVASSPPPGVTASLSLPTACWSTAPARWPSSRSSVPPWGTSNSSRSA